MNLPKTFRWVLLLILVVLAFYWKLVFTKQFSVLWQWETANTTYAWYTFVARSVHQGILPLWDPYRFAGTSFVGEMQTALFYPLNFAVYLAPLGRDGLLSERVFNLFYAFSHWLAAVWMFVLARHLKLGSFAAFVAAVCFGLGGFVQRVAWVYMLDAMVWLPLVVLFLLRSLEDPNRSGRIFNAVTAGLMLGMTFLAGSLHIAIMDGIVVVALAGYLSLRKRAEIPPLNAASAILIVALVSILFGAVQLLPSIEYGRLAYRWVGNDAPIKSFEKIQYPLLADEANFGPRSLFAFVFGEADSGNHEATTYFGIMPLILVLIGVSVYWKRPVVQFFSVLGALAYIYGWGSFSLLHGVLYLFPFLDMAREAGRFIYLTHFSMAVLAGFGVQALFEEREPGQTISFSTLNSILKCTVVGLAALLAAASLGTPIAASAWTYLSFFFIASSYLLLLAIQRGFALTAARLILVFLIAWDLYAFNWTVQPKMGLQKRGEDYVARLVEDRKLAEFVKSQDAMARVHFDSPVSPNIGNTYGVPVTWAMAATMLADYAPHFRHPRQNELLNVRYTVRSADQTDARVPVYSDKSWKVYENADALPRAWLVHHVEVDSSKERPLQRLNDLKFDLRKTALVDRPIDRLPGEDPDPATEDIQWLAYGPNRLELQVTQTRAGLVVLSEVFYPGWSASVDGAEVVIYRVDGFLRGVQVDAGSHRLQMRYQPGSIRWGALFTLLTLGAWTGWGIFRLVGKNGLYR